MSLIARLVLAFSREDTCRLIPAKLTRSVVSAILRTCRAWKFCLCP